MPIDGWLWLVMSINTWLWIGKAGDDYGWLVMVYDFWKCKALSGVGL